MHRADAILGYSEFTEAYILASYMIVINSHSDPNYPQHDTYHQYHSYVSVFRNVYHIRHVKAEWHHRHFRNKCSGPIIVSKP